MARAMWTRYVPGLVAALVLVSCGGSSDSTGRTRNATVGDESAKCITASTVDMDASQLEVTFCEEALLATVFYGESSAEADADSIGVPVSRTWSPTRDLTGISRIRIQSLGSEGNVLFDETIDLTLEDVTAKTCAEGGACKVGDEAPKGGRVFYVADTPQPWGSYLVMTPQLGGRVEFGCNDVVISGTADGIGKGIANTQIISEACKGSSPIIKALEDQACCLYLPTREELALAAKNLQGIEGFDPRATESNGYSRPVASNMPILGFEDVRESEVNRYVTSIDFMLYPNWSRLYTPRTTPLAIWPVYALPEVKPAITSLSVRKTAIAEEPTTNTTGSVDDITCGVSQDEIIDNRMGDYRTGDLPRTFECADVSGANFSGRDLSNLSFRIANVSRANFTNANLSGADFTNANCRGTVFTGATLAGAIFSGSLCPDPSVAAPVAPTDDIDAVATACRDSDVVPQILGDELTTDAPVQVVLEQGCDIPTPLSNTVKVFYDIVVSGQKHFVEWGTEHEIRELSPTTLQQVLPADSYRLTYTRWVVVERANGPQADMNPQGSFEFEVKEGQTVVVPTCSLSDLTFEDSTLTFPCSATPNLAVTHVTWDGDASRVEGAEGKVNLKSIPAGWQRISLTMSGELVNNSWAFLGCHTKCGPVAPDSNYRINKVDGTVSVTLPKCTANTWTTPANISPLFKVARGLLHVPTSQWSTELSRTSHYSPKYGFVTDVRETAITMLESDLVAGVLLSESDECIEGVSSHQLSVFEPTVDDVSKIEVPQAEPAYPVIINTAASTSAPIVVPEGTKFLSVTVTADPATSASVALSLDGNQWLPIVGGQATRVSVDKDTKLSVRTVDKNGVEKVSSQEVVSSGSPNVIPTSPAGPSGQDGSSTKNSTNYLMILLLALVLIFILFIINLILKFVRK